jgi:hypothetical protein
LEIFKRWYGNSNYNRKSIIKHSFYRVLKEENMVFPNSNPKESKFLVLYGVDVDYGEVEHFEWADNLQKLEKMIKDLCEYTIYFVGEIAILKDLTNMEK